MLGLLRAQHTYQVPILGDNFLGRKFFALILVLERVGKIGYCKKFVFWELIPCTDLAKGKIRDKNTQARLLAYDCFFIAGTHIEGNNATTLYDGPGVDYAIAIEWAEAALE